MKFFVKLNPKLFRSKKSRSVSKSDPPSFSSVSKFDPSSFSSVSKSDQSTFSYGSSSSESLDSSSSSHHHKSDPGKATPKSVLRSSSPEISEISGDLSSSDVYVELVHAFKMIDKDGDGKITREELEAVLSRIGAEPPSEEELRMMLSDVDRNGNGCIGLEEFSAISSAFGPPSCDSELRDAFEFFDTDRDGLITAEELQAVFASIGDDRCTLEECKRMLSGVDNNGDGVVCFEDFARMMKPQMT